MDIAQPVKKGFYTGVRALGKHSPQVFTGLGIIGMGASLYLACKNVPKAQRAIMQREDEVRRDLTFKEKVVVSYKFFIPAAVTSVASIGLLTSGSVVALKRNMALTTALTASDRAYNMYKDQVKETVSEEMFRTIDEKVVEKQMIEARKVPRQNNELVGVGDQVCFDCQTGREFRNNVNHINKVVNELNARLRTEMYISLNEFYYEIGLPPVDMGDVLGWHMDTGYIDIEFTTHLNDNDIPCVVLRYKTVCRYNH